MGTMSASDAAPLPRLGEVFFDVRGNSRSMRLSWYADTGVAVLSIWQGGMCTGTFRLAIADLPRMVQTLQRGPDGQQPGWNGEAPGQEFGDATAQVRAMGPMSGQMMQPAPDFRDDGPGTPDRGRYRNGTTDYLAEPLDNRDQAADHVPGPAPVGYPGEPLPADPRGGTPDYAAEPQGPRTGATEYPAEPQGPRTGATEYPAAPTGRRGRSGQYPAEPPRPMPEPPAGPVGYPGEPQPQDRRGRAPDYLADPLDVLGQLGVPETPATPEPYQNGAPEYLPAPPPEQPRPTEYLTEPPPDQRPRPADYLTGPPPDQGPRPTEYLSEPPPDQRPRPADYLTGPPPDQGPRPTEYLSEPPPDQRPRPADYLTGPSGYPAGPPQQGTGYLADLPAAPNAERAGYGADFHAGAGPGSSYPGAGDGGTYPRDTGHQGSYPGEPASDPYLTGTGPMDYQGEAPVSHYPGASSAPRSSHRSDARSNRRSAPRSGPGSAPQGDALGPSTADYPVHYGAALTDDMADEPPLESFPYQPRRGSR
jgi:hypothetical protein